jgi:hypothetical protein
VGQAGQAVDAHDKGGGSGQQVHHQGHAQQWLLANALHNLPHCELVCFWTLLFVWRIFLKEIANFFVVHLSSRIVEYFKNHLFYLSLRISNPRFFVSDSDWPLPNIGLFFKVKKSVLSIGPLQASTS